MLSEGQDGPLCCSGVEMIHPGVLGPGWSVLSPGGWDGPSCYLVARMVCSITWGLRWSVLFPGVQNGPSYCLMTEVDWLSGSWDGLSCCVGANMLLPVAQELRRSGLFEEAGALRACWVSRFCSPTCSSVKTDPHVGFLLKEQFPADWWPELCVERACLDTPIGAFLLITVRLWAGSKAPSTLYLPVIPALCFQ